MDRVQEAWKLITSQGEIPTLLLMLVFFAVVVIVMLDMRMRKNESSLKEILRICKELGIIQPKQIGNS